MRPSLILIGCILIASCARIPAASVELNEEINREMQRMHSLNKALAYQLFESKKELVRQFIRYEYSPDFIARSLSALEAAGYRVEDSLETVVYQLSMQINEREMNMIKELEILRDSSLMAMERDYDYLRMAGGEMQRFLKSASAVEKERKEIYALTHQLTQQRLNLQQLDQRFNTILLKVSRGADAFSNMNTTLTAKP